MKTLNGYLALSPVHKQGVFEVMETAVFTVDAVASLSTEDDVLRGDVLIKVGDTVVADTQYILEITVSGEPKFFIKEDYVVAIL